MLKFGFGLFLAVRDLDSGAFSGGSRRGVFCWMARGTLFGVLFFCSIPRTRSISGLRRGVCGLTMSAAAKHLEMTEGFAVDAKRVDAE